MVRLGCVGSTNDVALALAARGAPAGTIVVAGSQRAGRGRRGRAWDSPGGGNLYCSVVLRPRRPQRDWPGLSPAVAAGVALAAAELGVRGLALKHPNDVIATGRKLAGVLLEARSGSGGACLVAGIGVNVARHPREVPGGLRTPATSLAAELGGAVDAAKVLGCVCAAVEESVALWEQGGGEAVLARLGARGIAATGAARRGRAEEG